MKTIDVISVAALVAILSYIGDLIGRIRDKRIRAKVEQVEASKDEVEIRGMVLDDVRGTTALQSAMLLDLRSQLATMRDELQMKGVEIAELQREKRQWQREKIGLYEEIGKLHRQVEGLGRNANG